jgi:hypothetical protein
MVLRQITSKHESLNFRPQRKEVHFRLPLNLPMFYHTNRFLVAALESAPCGDIIPFGPFSQTSTPKVVDETCSTDATPLLEGGANINQDPELRVSNPNTSESVHQ